MGNTKLTYTSRISELSHCNLETSDSRSNDDIGFIELQVLCRTFPVKSHHFLIKVSTVIQYLVQSKESSDVCKSTISILNNIR